MRRILAVAAAAGMLITAGPAAAAYFFDDFSSGTIFWQAKSNSVFQGQVVNDPLDATNKVLNFNGLNVGGSIVTTQNFVAANGPFILSFDYLGFPAPSQTSTWGLGGFAGVGIASGDPCNCWLAGTNASYTGAFGTVTHLVDDGAWHHYSMVFDPRTQPALNPVFRLMLEDLNTAGLPGAGAINVAGDAYFDNVMLTEVPEPSAVLLMALGLAGLVAFRRRA